MAEKKQNENNVKKASDKKERTLKLMEAKNADLSQRYGSKLIKKKNGG